MSDESERTAGEKLCGAGSTPKCGGSGGNSSHQGHNAGRSGIEDADSFPPRKRNKQGQFIKGDKGGRVGGGRPPGGGGPTRQAPEPGAGPMAVSDLPRRKAGPAGATVHAAEFRQLLQAATTETERLEFVRQLFDLARAGDPMSINILADRILPKPKSVTPPVEFDMDLTNPAQTAVSILAAVSSGKLSTDQGQSLISALTNTIELGQMQSMAGQLENLKSVLAELIESK